MPRTRCANRKKRPSQRHGLGAKRMPKAGGMFKTKAARLGVRHAINSTKATEGPTHCAVLDFCELKIEAITQRITERKREQKPRALPHMNEKLDARLRRAVDKWSRERQIAYLSATFFAVVLLPVEDFFVVDFLVVDFLAAVFLAALFLVVAAFLPLAARPRAGFFSLLGQSMFTQMRQGPRAVLTTTIGAPHSGQVSPVASSLPRAGKG